VINYRSYKASERCSVPVEKVSYYSSSASELNKLITCTSNVNWSFSCCFSSRCPDLCSSSTCTAYTEVPHVTLLVINPCSTETIVHPSAKRSCIQRVIASADRLQKVRRPMRSATEDAASNEVAYIRCGVQCYRLQKVWLPMRSATEDAASNEVAYRRCGFQCDRLQKVRRPTRSATEGVASIAVGYRRCGVQRGRIQKVWRPLRSAIESLRTK
jgi:hypothetical protein